MAARTATRARAPYKARRRNEMGMLRTGPGPGAPSPENGSDCSKGKGDAGSMTVRAGADTRPSNGFASCGAEIDALLQKSRHFSSAAASPDPCSWPAASCTCAGAAGEWAGLSTHAWTTPMASPSTQNSTTRAAQRRRDLRVVNICLWRLVCLGSLEGGGTPAFELDQAGELEPVQHPHLDTAVTADAAELLKAHDSVSFCILQSRGVLLQADAGQDDRKRHPRCGQQGNPDQPRPCFMHQQPSGGNEEPDGNEGGDSRDRGAGRRC